MLRLWKTLEIRDVLKDYGSSKAVILPIEHDTTTCLGPILPEWIDYTNDSRSGDSTSKRKSDFGKNQTHFESSLSLLLNNDGIRKVCTVFVRGITVSLSTLSPHIFAKK